MNGMSSKQSRNNITVDEVLSLLKKTSLPTLVVEGSDDMIVYRTFEQVLSHIGVSVFPVGGRTKVLEVFRRKNEIPSTVRILFIADQDVWVNSGIPAEFCDDRLLFTQGYSIENDVYVDGELWKLLRGSECTNFQRDLAAFVDWYALALARHISDPCCPIALHPDHVLNPNENAALIELRSNETYPAALRQQIHSDYQRLLRGKSLIALLVRNTNYKGRDPRHSDKALLELVAVRPGSILQAMMRKVESLV